eukprot:m.33580 g.33580  ORF g.33580 m.33580 type:complete len:99 (+) comp10902_c0_seq2:548-844(+)
MNPPHQVDRHLTSVLSLWGDRLCGLGVSSFSSWLRCRPPAASCLPSRCLSYCLGSRVPLPSCILNAAVSSLLYLTRVLCAVSLASIVPPQCLAVGPRP